MLSRLVSIHGAPLFMRSDNGPEFVSPAILEWIAHVLCVWIYRALGRWQRVSEPSRGQRQDLTPAPRLRPRLRMAGRASSVRTVHDAA